MDNIFLILDHLTKIQKRKNRENSLSLSNWLTISLWFHLANFPERHSNNQRTSLSDTGKKPSQRIQRSARETIGD
jgi:hypothetical protein